jgi:hypothetical protein
MATPGDETQPTEPEVSTSATTDERGGVRPRPMPRTASARYRMTDRLGRGGMGEITAAWDEQIGRDVAIKRMRAADPSPRAVERFLREARIQGRLDHPAIVPVYELGREPDGRPYFAMKKLAGTTLAAILAGPGAPRQRLLRAFADVCLAVELAHRRGVIHRDLKPENIMLGDLGETYVLDWGVAKVLGETDPEPDEEASCAVATEAGAAVGTAGYMAPEQARGDTAIDARADVYSLGCVLFEILAGEPLHPRGRAGEPSALAEADGRPSLRAPDRDIPPELDALCAQATAADREARIATARELGERVQRYLDGDRDLSVRRSLAAAHLAAATAAFAADDRPAALREAARALSLDPRLGGAGELITRIMMEPPAHVPPEVEAALDDDGERVVRRMVKPIALVNLGYLLFVPFLVGRVPAAYIGLLCGLVAAKIAVMWGMTRLGGAALRYVRFGLNMLAIALVVRLSSPVLFAPGIAAITAVTAVMSPLFRTLRDGILYGVSISLAVLVPWLLEQLGTLEKTVWVEGGRLVISAPALGGELGIYTAIALSTPVVVLFSILTTHGFRLAERASRRQVRLQAWQLGQLVR